MNQMISDSSLFLLQFIWNIISQINYSERPSHQTTSLLKKFQSLPSVYSNRDLVSSIISYLAKYVEIESMQGLDVLRSKFHGGTVTASTQQGRSIGGYQGRHKATSNTLIQI